VRSSEAEHEARLDELMSDVAGAVEIHGTDSPEHLAAIDAFERYATSWPGPEPEVESEPELEP
jgi:hypothetical protein